MACGMWADVGADGGAAGVYPPKENPSLPLRPPRAGAGERGRGDGMRGEYD